MAWLGVGVGVDWFFTRERSVGVGLELGLGPGLELGLGVGSESAIRMGILGLGLGKWHIL